MRPGLTWLQLDVALARRAGGATASARKVFARLGERLPSWREQGAVQCFFFTRKPPDLRLRFGGVEPGPRLEAQLSDLLRDLVASGDVTAFHAAVYEPEARLFGGERAMALIHRWFDRDTVGWLERDRLAQLGALATPIEVQIAATIDDLLTRTLADVSEIWDAWCNHRDLVLRDPATRPIPEAGEPGPLSTLERLEAGAAAEEAAMIAGHREANRALADGLLALRRGRQLQGGLRVILAFLALFHCNRHGLDQQRQLQLATAMARAWDPRRGLRGVD